VLDQIYLSLLFLDQKCNAGTVSFESSTANCLRSFLEVLLANVRKLPSGGPSKTDDHNKVYMQLWADILQIVCRLKAKFGVEFDAACYQSIIRCVKEILMSSGDVVKSRITAQALQLVPSFQRRLYGTSFHWVKRRDQMTTIQLTTSDDMFKSFLLLQYGHLIDKKFVHRKIPDNINLPIKTSVELL
jgi:hypothetical protein